MRAPDELLKSALAVIDTAFRTQIKLGKWPHRIVFATGMDGLGEGLGKTLGAGLLRKPYTQSDLDKVLDGLFRA